jgi:hypothetical protein
MTGQTTRALNESYGGATSFVKDRRRMARPIRRWSQGGPTAQRSASGRTGIGRCRLVMSDHSVHPQYGPPRLLIISWSGGGCHPIRASGIGAIASALFTPFLGALLWQSQVRPSSVRTYGLRRAHSGQRRTVGRSNGLFGVHDAEYVCSEELHAARLPVLHPAASGLESISHEVGLSGVEQSAAEPYRKRRPLPLHEGQSGLHGR